MKYKKGQIVKVWSLQSWQHGGFLKGEKAIVRQDQSGDSVILCVVRNIEGTYKLDTSYEVYAKQCEPYNSEEETYSEYRTKLELLGDVQKVLLQGKSIAEEMGEGKYL